jgi:mannonate dehydratase
LQLGATHTVNIQREDPWPLIQKLGDGYGADLVVDCTGVSAALKQSMWDNYIHFIRQVVPVAEEAGVRIGIRPDDPPVYDVGGIPRCIFGSFAGYCRALELADSPNIGVCLCVGCWLEGGERMGRSVIETIRYFGGLGKLFKVHLRNVTAPLPAGFVETFLDDGYGDMAAVVRALHEVGFDGLAISDHIPNMVGGRYASEALAVGAMKGLAQMVESASASAAARVGSAGMAPR